MGGSASKSKREDVDLTQDSQKQLLNEKPGGEPRAIGSSNRSQADLGWAGGGVPGTGPRKKSSVIRKRVGSAGTTDRPFERSGGNISGKTSSANVITKITMISRPEYHKNLKTNLTGGLNVNLVFAAFIILLGSSFPFGYNIGILNQPETLIKDFFHRTLEERYEENVTESSLSLTWSLTTAFFIPGGMIGTVLGGFLADSFGRKKTILLSHIFVFIGAALSAACVAAGSPELLMIGRIFVGINSGMGICIAPMFLSEICTFNCRGAFGTMHQLFITIGILISSMLGITYLLGTSDRWMHLILIEAFPCLLSLLVLPFLPETPRYLLLVRADRQAAIKSLKFYRKTQDVTTDMEEMNTENQQSQSSGSSGGSSGKEFTLRRMLTLRDLRRPLFIACMLQVVQQLSGVNAVFFFSKSIFMSVKVQTDHIQYAVVGTNFVNVLMTFVAVPLMDIAGRRPLLLVSMVAMIFNLMAMTICRVLYENDQTLTYLAYFSVVCVVLYIIAFAVGLGPIPMMIGSELFRQGPRPLAMAIAGLFNWVFTFFVVVSFPFIQEALGNYTFIAYMFFLAGFTVFVYSFVPETKNKTFEEIAHQFSPGDHLEIEEVIKVEGEEIPPAPEVSLGDDPDADRLVTLNVADKEQVIEEEGEEIPPAPEVSPGDDPDADRLVTLNVADKEQNKHKRAKRSIEASEPNAKKSKQKAEKSRKEVANICVPHCRCMEMELPRFNFMSLPLAKLVDLVPILQQKVRVLDGEFIKEGQLCRMVVSDGTGKLLHNLFIAPHAGVGHRDWTGHHVGPAKEQIAIEKARSIVSAELKDRILVAHDPRRDLQKLGIQVPETSIRDTSKYRLIRRKTGTGKFRVTLKKALGLYGWTIQSRTHCPYQDCLASLYLYLRFHQEWETEVSFVIAAKSWNQKPDIMFAVDESPVFIFRAPFVKSLDSSFLDDSANISATSSDLCLRATNQRCSIKNIFNRDSSELHPRLQRRYRVRRVRVKVQSLKIENLKVVIYEHTKLQKMFPRSVSKNFPPPTPQKFLATGHVPRERERQRERKRKFKETVPDCVIRRLKFLDHFDDAKSPMPTYNSRKRSRQS